MQRAHEACAWKRAHERVEKRISKGERREDLMEAWPRSVTVDQKRTLCTSGASTDCAAYNNKSWVLAYYLVLEFTRRFERPVMREPLAGRDGSAPRTAWGGY